MLSKILSNIIDNVQIKVSHVCVRYEDDLSNPKVPFCIGLTIEEITAFTANDDWEKEFVTKKAVCNKSLALTNLSLFLDFKENIFYDEITKNFEIKDLHSDLRKQFIDGKSKPKLFNIMRYKHFITADYQANLKNSYILKNFCIECRLKLNKNPKENNLPQVDLELIIGGKFDNSINKVALYFQPQQLQSLLKFLEYSGHYTKFQDEVLKEFREKEFTKKETEEYLALYTEFKLNKDNSKAFKRNKAELEGIEEDYSYEAIAPIRNIAFNKYLFEMKKEEEKKEIQKKVKDYASSKTSVMSSLGGFFGFSNAKKKEEDQKEINEFQDKLDKEFYENFRIEEGKLNQEIDDFLQKKSIFDPD